MADPLRYPDSKGDTVSESDRGSPTSTPRWVKVFGIAIAIVLLLLIVILHLTGILGPGVE